MKPAEEHHHTEKYVKAMREANGPNWRCGCASCENVRAIQADARAELLAKIEQMEEDAQQASWERDERD